jgi:type IV pilus assembly protein PilC
MKINIRLLARKTNNYFKIKDIDIGISPKYLILFFEELSVLLESGILLSDALECLSTRFPDKKTKLVISTIFTQIIESKSNLSQALALFPKIFSPSIIAVIEAGEQGGALLLAQRFRDLAERVNYEQSLKIQLSRAIAYPLLVLFLSLGLYILLLEVVFPRLSDLLLSLGSDLPPLAKAIIFIASIMRKLWPVIIIALLTIPVIISLGRKKQYFKNYIDYWLIKIPLIGEIYCTIKAALICRVFRSLYISNQPITLILDLCTKLVSNETIRLSLVRAKYEITQNGSTLSAAFAGTGIFPPLACLALEIGERSGKIAPTLERISDYLAKKSKDKIDVIISIINPVLTLIVVGGAGIILISFFQATYQIIYATQ